ncbi:hypothetical protein ACFFGH_09850 [Lysobacter korlensis]|uniref:GNAT family N-acetyltransferase n=1 Tax=Lysobacter korlensis TaxID=553636 RepID=A0ABV6RMC9_9GAMM
MTSTVHPPANPRLEVVALSDHEWRVCDRVLDKADPRRVLGYIERSGEGFEVLALLPAPTPCGRFAGWNAALSVISALALRDGLVAPGFAGGAAG